MRLRAPTALFLASLLAGCPGPNTAKPVREKRVPYVSPGNNPALPAGPQQPLTHAPGLPTVSDPLATPAPPATPAPANPPGTVTTLAGTGQAGYADGPGAQAAFDGPTGLAFAPDGALLVADHNNHALRRIDLADPNHAVTTLAGATTGGKDAAGFADGDAGTARFRGPMGLAVGPDGSIYIADAGNHRVRELAGGKVTTIAGTDASGARMGPGAQAGFVFPTGLALDGKGGLYVTDSADNRIDRIDLTKDTHMVDAVAGNGDAASRDGVGAEASFSAPFGVTTDAQGNALVADPGNHRVRRVSPDGTVKSIPVGPTAGTFPFQPSGIALRSDGTLVVSDVGNHRLLSIPQPRGTADPDTRLIAGRDEGRGDGTGSLAKFDTPEAVVVGADGTIYVADTANNQIRMVKAGGRSTPAAPSATPAASPVPSASPSPRQSPRPSASP